MVDLEPILVRAEVKDGERVLDLVDIPLGYEGTGYSTLPFRPCDSSENTWKVTFVSICHMSEKDARLSAEHR